jgi:hypothetical protein
MEGLPDTIDFMEIIQVYKTKVINFYDWFFSCLQSIHAEDIEFYNATTAEIERLVALDYECLPALFPIATTKPESMGAKPGIGEH